MPSGHCLEGYTVARRQRDRREDLAAARLQRRSGEALERCINTQSIYAQVDENGRIVLPQKLRDMFGLDEEALFAGMGEHFQIWAPEAMPHGHGGARCLARSALDDDDDPFAAARRRWTARTGHDDGAGRAARPGPARRRSSQAVAPVARHLARRHLRRRRLCARPARGRRRPGDRHRPRSRGARDRAGGWARRATATGSTCAQGRFGELDRSPLGRRAGARRRGARHRRLLDAARPGRARLLLPAATGRSTCGWSGAGPRPPTW